MRSNRLAWAPPVYFLYYAAAAALSPFLLLYYQDLGLMGTQIGVLAALPALISLLSASVWGGVADLTHQHKLSLLAAIAGSILFALALSVSRIFAWLIPVVILYAFFSSPVMPLVDSTTLRLLGEHKARYGRIRIWGAVGWGIAAPVTGWLIQTHSLTWSFWSYAALMSLGLLIATRIPVDAGRKNAAQGQLQVFLNNRRWMAFLAVTFLAGVCFAMVSSYLFIYLRSLGGNETLLGLALTFATFSELPVLFFSNRLLQRWSPIRLMNAAILIYAVRALAYTLLSGPLPALLIQMLHGPTYSLLWIAGISLADRMAPPELSATAQGLFAGVLLGVGAATGSLLGGLTFEHINLVSVFRLAGLIALVGAVILFFVERRTHVESV
jgi:PPP family 3-phenylpropionic acid transporter